MRLVLRGVALRCVRAVWSRSAVQCRMGSDGGGAVVRGRVGCLISPGCSAGGGCCWRRFKTACVERAFGAFFFLGATVGARVLKTVDRSLRHVPAIDSVASLYMAVLTLQAVPTSLCDGWDSNPVSQNHMNLSHRQERRKVAETVGAQISRDMAAWVRILPVSLRRRHHCHLWRC